MRNGLSLNSQIHFNFPRAPCHFIQVSDRSAQRAKGLGIQHQPGLLSLHAQLFVLRN